MQTITFESKVLAIGHAQQKMHRRQNPSPDRGKHGLNYTNTEEELEDHTVAVNRDQFNWTDILETDNVDYNKLNYHKPRQLLTSYQKKLITTN